MYLSKIFDGRVEEEGKLAKIMRLCFAEENKVYFKNIFIVLKILIQEYFARFLGCICVLCDLKSEHRYIIHF